MYIVGVSLYMYLSVCLWTALCAHVVSLSTFVFASVGDITNLHVHVCLHVYTSRHKVNLTKSGLLAVFKGECVGLCVENPECHFKVVIDYPH